MSGLPIRRRRGDWFFVVVCVLFACTSLLVDAPTLLFTWVTGDPTAWPLSPAAIPSYAAIDPLLMADPVFLRVAVALSGFVWGPLTLYLARGFYRGDNGIRTAGIAYGAALSAVMLLVLAEELFSEVEGWRTPSPVVYMAYNLPYFLFPLAVLVRLWRPFPFGMPTELGDRE